MSDKNDHDDSHEDEIASIGDETLSSAAPAELAQKISQLAADLDKAKKDYLYLRADFDNYKKAVIKERADLVRYGNERAFVEILDVLDTFERALELELTPDNMASFKEGVVLTAAELKKVLERFGVKEIECQNLPFDPTLHEALSSEETDTISPGHVSRVFKKAYRLHDRVLRPAQVVVAKAPSKTEG